MSLARIQTDPRQAQYAGIQEYPSNQTTSFSGLECLVELRADDAATGIQFRECLIDYTRCPNQSCIKKLL
ncbi:MAG: hypothetical protein RIF32_12615 [Leptospirales bacterium]|jgi:hypothetical protein